MKGTCEASRLAKAYLEQEGICFEDDPIEAFKEQHNVCIDKPEMILMPTFNDILGVYS